MDSIVARSLLRQRASKLALTTAVAAVIALPAQADDLDVYRAQIAKQQKPNILFVLDYSSSMNRDINGEETDDSGLKSRIDILRKSVTETLDDNLHTANFGIGSIFSWKPSGVRWPITDLTIDAHTIDPEIPEGKFTARQIIEKQLDRHEVNGSTNTVNALVESALYFKGGRVAHRDLNPNWPNHHRPDRWNTAISQYDSGNRFASIPASYSPRNAFKYNVPYAGQRGECFDYTDVGGLNNCAYVDVIQSTCTTNAVVGTGGEFVRCEYQNRDRWTGATYVSPIDNQCQVNAMVLISDGEPTKHYDNDSLKEVAGTSLSGCKDLSKTIFKDSDDTSKEGNCGPEIVASMAENPQNPKYDKSFVKTYTVGFSVDDEGGGKKYLELLAKKGQGKFIEANSEDSLKQALKELILQIRGDGQSFSELTVDVNRATFSHDNRVYMNLFSPSNNDSWKGNVKGYFYDSEGLKDINGNNAIVTDQTGTYFAANAQSFWSLEADGNKAEQGGASSRLIAENRKLYTYLGDAIGTTGVDLSLNTDHELRADNSAITNQHLGLADDATERDGVLNWLQNAPIGDPLHSQAATVNYGNQTVVYSMTNQGLLHAIDATAPKDMDGSSLGGEELFAFMPKRLLSNLPKLAEETSTGQHIYGLDGALTRWHEDDNNDGIVNGTDTVMLVFGMRRGGSAYYALDVTEPNSPKLMWTLDNNSAGFEQLAQSWSRAALVRVNNGGTSERVLVFAGGYDADELDGEDARKATKGNAIYMVNRLGKRIWSASNTSASTIVAEMKYAIPSDITIIDTNGDRNADRLYVGDVGGQVWRVDFDDINSGTGFVVTQLADFDNGSPQRFFYAPSVALTGAGKNSYFSVALGSGDRTDPLNSSARNALFMLKDPDVDTGAPSAKPAVVAVSQLYDATENRVGSDDGDVAKAAKEALSKAKGWMVRLVDGEKSLSRLVTFENRLMATTFREIDASNDCGVGIEGRFYMMDVASAQPLAFADSEDEDDTDTDETGDSDDTANKNPRSRFRIIKTRGIPSSPLILFPQDGSSVQVMVDRQTVDIFDQRLATIFWHSR